jgi:O-antigen biosynthesis protein
LPTVPIACCPVCGGLLFGTLGTRSDGIAVRQCQRCRMGVVAARQPDPAATYGDAYYLGAEEAATGYADYRLVAAHSLAWAAALVRLLQAGGRVLDVGCADGHLLGLLEGSGERFGIEVNPGFREQCTRAGIRILGADICAADLLTEYRDAFDIITAIAVLEHIPDLRGALQSLHSLLAPEGVLIFEVPLISARGDNRVWFSSSLEHIHYPTVEGLSFLFESVFAMPLLGSEVVIQDYGSTFVGLATRSPARYRELTGLWSRLLETPIADLASSAERSFRFFFDLVHAAQPTLENVALLAEQDPAGLTPELLQRLATLWNLELARGLARRAGSAATPAPATSANWRARAGVLSVALAAERARTQHLARDAEARDRRVLQLEPELALLKTQLAERDESLREAARQADTLRQQLAAVRGDLHRIYSSRSWRLMVRFWRAKLFLLLPWHALRSGLRARSTDATASATAGTTRLGVALWRLARLCYRLLPLSGSARFRLRNRVLSSLSLPADAAPQTAVTRFGAVVRALSWRRAFAALPLLARGDLPALRMHLTQLAQHSANQATQDCLAEPSVASFVTRQAEPWPATEPLVSVIVVCYNYGRYIAEAVDSVLAQTFPNLEILIVDGGSDDGSQATLRELRRPKTQVFLREERHLQGDNRNFGIARARGKYVCCLDADDKLLPTYLEKCLFLLETQGFDLVSSSIQTFGERSEVFHVERLPVLADMLRGNHVSICAVFRRSLWAAAGGFHDTGIGGDYTYEDWRLWVRLSALGARFANLVDEPLFLYRLHPGQTTQDKGLPSMDRQREAMQRFNQDVITEEALRASEENRALRVRVENGLVNLRNPGPDSPPPAPTILIAMPFLVIGGAERLLSEVLSHLAGRGFRIVLVTTEYVYPSYGDATPWFAATTAEIYQLPRFLEASAWREFIFYLLETRQPELLWIIGSRVFYDLLPAIRAAAPTIKVIDLLFNTVGHTVSNRKYADYFDKILVENREVEEWLRRAGEPRQRVVRIPSGVRLDAYRPAPRPAALCDELGISPESFVAGFSGRLSEEKDPEAFLDIARLCRGEGQLRFLMTGAGPLAEQVQRRIEKMALGDRLRFLGQVENIREVMGAYDVLLLPSRFDGRPLAVLESLALGVPVIASRVGSLPDLVQDGVTGFLCEPGDVHAFAERIRWLVRHPAEHRRMRLAARAFAEAELDARQMLAAYEQAIRDVLAGQTVGSRS